MKAAGTSFSQFTSIWMGRSSGQLQSTHFLDVWILRGNRAPSGRSQVRAKMMEICVGLTLHPAPRDAALSARE